MKRIYFMHKKLLLLLMTIIFPVLQALHSQEISFGSSGLLGESISNPTSIDFGPDGNLYVAQQDGTIWQMRIERDNAEVGQGTYTVISKNSILSIKTGITNHSDSGVATTLRKRQVTGIMTAGTASNPILYVTSSNPIHGGGPKGIEENIDTNSSVLSQLTWNGSSWDKVDLIRGLPRCEENHSINGLDSFERNGQSYLLVQQGGHSNKGAPSNNFAGTPEYLLSGTILIVNLTQLEAMSVYTDSRDGTQFKYDLPTLNDPNREDITNTDTRFPYSADHPLYQATIDVNDPFGGDDSLNQAFTEAGGPVQVFSRGFRNAFDIVITEEGHIYTFDNGPNTGWGGQPVIYDSNDQRKGDQSTTTYNPENGDYLKNEFNESGSVKHGDALHYVGSVNDSNQTYYGGHPNPIAAFPSRANLIVYKKINGSWDETFQTPLGNTLENTSGYFQNTFSITDFPDNPRQGNYLAGAINSTEVRILDVIDSSTNGMCEYTASNFDGALKGSLLSAALNGKIYRHVPNAAKTSYDLREELFDGFGSRPLDVIAMPDDHQFPGTVWAATYGSNNITIFEPTDIDCIGVDEYLYDAEADYDSDGYSNADEELNGTNSCSAGSTPNDFDQDFLSDLQDQDDDNDALLDVLDPFAIDPTNGLSTNLPVEYPFWNNDPGTGFFGLGFTGLMVDPSGNTDYLDQFDENLISFGGAAGKASVDLVPGGQAFEQFNDQEYAFQFGINVDTTSNPFTIHSRVESPFFGINGQDSDPAGLQSAGIYMGNGDQDNYIKIVINTGTSDYDTLSGIGITTETEGLAVTNFYDIPGILDGNAVDLYFIVYPGQQLTQPYISLDGGNSSISIGEPITIPDSFLDATDQQGMAVGLIATSFDSTVDSPKFSAIWDFINVTENKIGELLATETAIDFDIVLLDNEPVTKPITIQNTGALTDPSLVISSIEFSGPDSNLFSTETAVPQEVNSGTELQIPITFTSDGTTGTKSALVTIMYADGSNPIQVSLTATIASDIVPIIRINAAGTSVASTDGGPAWQSNTSKDAFASDVYSVNTGQIGSFALPFNKRHASIPDYIDEATYTQIFKNERWDIGSAPEMQFTIPVSNNAHVVNLYFGNGWSGTAAVGKRQFDIEIEGVIQKADLDLIEEFEGHRVGGMLSFPVTVTDEVLNIRFLHKVQNPLVNAIEILGPAPTIDRELTIDPIADQENTVLERADFAVSASGGSLAENYLYEIEGQPDGILIEPTNGQISGVVETTAIDGGIAHDGVHYVTVTVSQIIAENIVSTTKEFTWTIKAQQSLTLSKPEDQEHQNGDLVSLQIEASAASPISYQATNLPPVLQIDSDTGLISGTISTDQSASNASNSYQESDGIVVIEAESVALDNTNWTLEDRNGATGIVAGSNHFNDQNGSTLSYDINFSTPGIYRIQWRSDFSGTNATDYNDSWMRMENDATTDFFAYGCYACNENTLTQSLDETQNRLLYPKGSSKVTAETTPKGSGSNGWFKSYRTGYKGWNWSTVTSDRQSYALYVRIKDAGVRTLQLSERSKGHIIDKIVLTRIENTFYSETQLANFPESSITNQNGVIKDLADTYDVSVVATTTNDTVTTNFIWTIEERMEEPEGIVWIDKNENEDYVARHECSFVQAGKDFILFGGRESSKRLDTYNFETNSWSQGGEAPVEFNHFQAVTYNDLVWVIGAFKTNTFPNEQPADYIHVYNPATKTWIQGSEIPVERRRGGAGLIVYKDKFYLVGGNTTGHNGGYVAWTDEYDPITGKWTVLDDAPRARDHFHAAVAYDKLYAAGGRLSGGSGGTFAPLVSEVDVFDFETKKWSTLVEPLPTPRAGTSTVNFQGEIYVIGGETATSANAFDTVEAYDPITNRWSTKAPLQHPRHGTQAIVSGNGIHITGGSPFRGGSRQKNMEVYHLDDPVGVTITNSTLQPESESITFRYESNAAPVLIPVTLENKNGTTGILLTNISLEGDHFELTEIYNDTQLISSGDQLTIPVSFVVSEATPSEATGTLIIDYNDGQQIRVDLNGSEGQPDVETVLYRINAGGAEIADSPINWEADYPS